MCILEKSLKRDFSIFFLGEIILSSWCSNSDFTLKKVFFVQYLSSFGQHTATSPSLTLLLFVAIDDLNMTLIHSHLSQLSSRKVGVHIADVTHFIRPGTALDDEAANRGTTVYLTDKVIVLLKSRTI